MREREHDVGDAAAVDVQRGQAHAAGMPEDAVEGVDRLARGAGDHGLVQRRVAVGDGGVDFDDRVAAVARVDEASCLAGAAEVVGLAVGRGAPALGLTRPTGARRGSRP